MAYASKVIYEGDGVTTDYNVPMPFLSRSHISVFINDILQLSTLHYVWTGASTIRFNDAPANTAAIEIKRFTSPSATLVDFENGSRLPEQDLDTAYLHNFYLTQEYSDGFNELINETLVAIASGAGIVETETDAIITALVNEMLNSANASNLLQRVNDIDANAEAIITLGESLQVQVNTLAQGTAAQVFVQAAEPVAGVGGVPDPIPEGARWYDSDDNNKPYIRQGGVWLSIEDPRIGNAVADISVLQTETADNAAAIVAESLARTTQDTAFASTLALLGAENPGGTAFVLDLNTTEVGGGESLANRFSSLTAATDAVAASVTAETAARTSADSALASDITLLQTDVGDNAAAILAETTARTNADTALAADITALTASVDGNAASIASESAARASGDSANASSITSLTATVNGNTSSITTQAAAISGLEAKYGVTLNVNGYITGFAQNNDGETGVFVILADKFAIVDPSGDPGETQYVPFEISGSKINLRGDVQIDGSLIINGTVNGTAVVAGSIGQTQIGTNAISTGQLNANAVTAVKIAANAVTAEKINVTNLAAISADLGAVTAGNITLNTAGFLRGGQTAYDTGSGFYLGYSGGAYRFSVGDGGDNSLTWDGTELEVKGNIKAGNYTSSGVQTTLLNAPTLRSVPSSSGWTEVKRFQVTRSGTVNVKGTYSLSSTSGGIATFGGARIKVNGVVQGSTIQVGAQSTVTRAVSVSPDSIITIELNGGGTRDPSNGPFAVDTRVINTSVTTGPTSGETVITN